MVGHSRKSEQFGEVAPPGNETKQIEENKSKRGPNGHLYRTAREKTLTFCMLQTCFGISHNGTCLGHFQMQRKPDLFRSFFADKFWKLSGPTQIKKKTFYGETMCTCAGLTQPARTRILEQFKYLQFPTIVQAIFAEVGNMRAIFERCQTPRRRRLRWS